MTIDNTDHALDIDYTEVTISRTLYRNGGSEYAINGSACRLLDIQELLSDSGLGQQMHVIVGQGGLDAILRADPSGHRAFIEGPPALSSTANARNGRCAIWRTPRTISRVSTICCAKSTANWALWDVRRVFSGVPNHPDDHQGRPSPAVRR